MKYLPAIICGVLLWLTLQIIFSFSANYSPINDFLNSQPNIGANSAEYIWLGVHDTFIKLILCFGFLIGYKTLCKKYPFNFTSALVIQLPSLLMVLLMTFNAVTLGNNSSITTYYGMVDAIGVLITAAGVLLVYWMISLIDKKPTIPAV
ncbi:hypothetical protein AAEU29_12050 [Pseudoalteromonas sp. SSM20]|uniref:hypothetical protein n=1 Tax=Pseudoalteromonas sp. SSM20 TaxID=3139394 RepID=UPI003BACEB9D